MSKQTAVEWLLDELETELFYAREMTRIDNKRILDEITKEAKAMEKEQIIDFGYDIADELACGKYWDKKAMEEKLQLLNDVSVKIEQEKKRKEEFTKNKNNETSKYEEGCLSVPDQFAEIERPNECEVEYLDYNGKNNC